MSKSSHMNGDVRRVIGDRTARREAQTEAADDRQVRRQDEGETPATRRRGHRRPTRQPSRLSSDETSVEIDAVQPGLMSRADLVPPPNRAYRGGEF